MNNKLILAGFYLGIFVLSSFIFSRSGGWKIQDVSQLFGLGGVVAGYFISKSVKRIR